METNNNSNSFLGHKNSFYVNTTAADNNEYAFKNIPTGLSAAFTQNAAAMTAFENMAPSMKRQIIEKASKISSKKDMIELVQNISMNNF